MQRLYRTFLGAKVHLVRFYNVGVRGMLFLIAISVQKESGAARALSALKTE